MFLIVKRELSPDFVEGMTFDEIIDYYREDSAALFDGATWEIKREDGE